MDCHVSPWSEWSSCPQQCVPGKCKGSALLSSVYGTASKDFRTGCKKTVNLLLKIDALQFDDCLYVYTHCSVVECSTQCVEFVCALILLIFHVVVINDSMKPISGHISLGFLRAK